MAQDIKEDAVMNMNGVAEKREEIIRVMLIVFLSFILLSSSASALTKQELYGFLRYELKDHLEKDSGVISNADLKILLNKYLEVKDLPGESEINVETLGLSASAKEVINLRYNNGRTEVGSGNDNSAGTNKGTSANDGEGGVIPKKIGEICTLDGPDRCNPGLECKKAYYLCIPGIGSHICISKRNKYARESSNRCRPEICNTNADCLDGSACVSELKYGWLGIKSKVKFCNNQLTKEQAYEYLRMK